MDLQNKIMRLYESEKRSVKEDRIIDILKLVLVDGLTDLEEIIKQAQTTKNTLEKYVTNETDLIKELIPEEYNVFFDKINEIIKEGKKQDSKDKKNKILTILKLVLVDNVMDLDIILEKTPITKNTLKKYLDENEFQKYLLPHEYDEFLNKFALILKRDENKKEIEDIKTIGNIINDINKTRLRIDEICTKNFITHTTFERLFTKEFVDKHFGEGVFEKTKQKIQENASLCKIKESEKNLIEEELEVEIVNDNLLYLGDLEYKKLNLAATYFMCEGDIQAVCDKFNIEKESTVINLLCLPIYKDILNEEYYQKLTYYMNIEQTMLSANLRVKEKYITDLLTCLQKNSFDIDVTVKETGVPKGLLIRILKDSLKYFFVSDNIKATIKSLLAGDNEDKKGSSIR